MILTDSNEEWIWIKTLVDEYEERSAAPNLVKAKVGQCAWRILNAFPQSKSFDFLKNSSSVGFFYFVSEFFFKMTVT